MIDFEKAVSERLKKYGFEEEKAELELNVPRTTGFPKPIYRHRLIIEAFNLYIEEHYFWLMDHLKQDWSYSYFYKLADVFAASEQSAFFGVSEQRLSLQQEKASQYLKGISEMVKSLFQLVREIRIIEERIDYYNDTFTRKANTARGSEISLKGVWVDMVEGGAKNPASVYGLAREVGFTILPDLFFRVEVDDFGMDKLIDKPEEYKKVMDSIMEKVDKKVDSLTEFNEKVREVLKRKLAQYYKWKHTTYKELYFRRKFTIKYLRQHYDTIRLYLGWIKPYLRNIKRLQLDQKRMDSADLIGAFEGAMIEIEVLAKKDRGTAPYYPVIITHFLYRTRPSMSYMQEGYQRGPAHVGQLDWSMRAYIWTQEEIDNYILMKEEEDLELLGSINESIREAMDALGDELKKYLIEGGEKMPREKKREEEKKKPKFELEPFTSLFGGFKQVFSPLFKIPELARERRAGKSAVEIDRIKSGIKGSLKTEVYQTYKNYKKAHGFVQW